MTNNSTMQNNFEREKNTKAAGITLLLSIILFIVFTFIRWTIPQEVPPPVETGIEVNLGNSESGNESASTAQQPGDPANDNTAINAAQPITEPNTPLPQPVDADPNEASTVTVPKPTAEPKKTPTVTPPPMVARAQMGKLDGGKDNGGNHGDSYDGTPREGSDNKGDGNKGRPNGTPNGDSYEGNAASGNKGIVIKSGLKGRKINKYPTFEDDFNENAKIAVDITVDTKGNVIEATVNPKAGTTTPNKSMWNIAIRKAKELKLTPATEDVEKGTIVFNFRLKED